MQFYRFTVQASDGDIDDNGHVNNIVYVQWMQDAAIAHSDHVGCTAATNASGCTWVARSHHIEYLRPAFAGDRITIATWVGVTSLKTASRRCYRIIRDSDGAILARGETLWVFIDMHSGRPRTIPREVISLFDPVPPDKEPDLRS